ncbi:gas vesicle protein [Geodermatophilus ruber]|uniref:Gas vesicle protein n=1 Tax=Geodermatophilus ruber TaxID=504800 RepID=A0A1I4GRT1_9ACTN|nr:gas vesicle protein [Geodermatophilus ruber]SFL32183.1 Gas vesicle protein [Geodermatophilus ruber]
MSLDPRVGNRPAPRADSLADVLERVLDKGVVIAGDIVVNIVDIELLSLKLRLFIASADTAKQMGMDWWSRDPFFSGSAAQVAGDETARLEAENRELRERLDRLERALAAAPPAPAGQTDGPPAPPEQS